MLVAIRSTIRAMLSAAGLCSMSAAALAVSPPPDKPAVIAVTESADNHLIGAYVESDYVAPHGVPIPRLQRLAAREAQQGRYDLDEALRYLKKSHRAAAIITRIERSGGRISIVVNHQCDDDQRMVEGGNSLIVWDPHCAYRVGSGADSPSLVLFHELVHTLHLAEDPQGEERRTILFGEIPVALELGETARRDHHENRPFRVNDPTVR